MYVHNNIVSCGIKGGGDMGGGGDMRGDMGGGGGVGWGTMSIYLSSGSCNGIRDVFKQRFN
jgi:hypothetical protein